MQKLSSLRNNYVPEIPAQVEFCASRILVYTRSATQRLPKICGKTSGLDPSYQKEPKLHIWTWDRERFLAFPLYTLQPDRSQHDRMCYHPAVFFRLLHLISLSFPQRKWGRVSKMLWFYSYYSFFSNAMTLKLPTPWRGISKLFFYVTALLSCALPQVFDSIKAKCFGWPCNYFGAACFQQLSPLLT